jgi:hypothetical protein
MKKAEGWSRLDAQPRAVVRFPEPAATQRRYANNIGGHGWARRVIAVSPGSPYDRIITGNGQRASVAERRFALPPEEGGSDTCSNLIFHMHSAY